MPSAYGEELSPIRKACADNKLRLKNQGLLRIGDMIDMLDTLLTNIRQLKVNLFKPLIEQCLLCSSISR